MADPTPTMRERAQLSVRAVAAKRDLGLLVGPDDETAFVDAVLAELEHPTEAMIAEAAKELEQWDRRFDSAETIAENALGEAIRAARDGK